MRHSLAVLLLLSTICILECFGAHSKIKYQNFKDGLLDANEEMRYIPSFVELQTSDPNANEMAFLEKAEVQSQSGTQKSPSSLYYSLASTAVATNQKVSSYIQDASSGLIMLASKTSANTRAIYLFLFAALTIVICCIGLQFILNNAKESRKYLTNIEKRRNRRTNSDHHQQNQQYQQVQGLNEASAALDVQSHRH